MSNPIRCPVCQNTHGGVCHTLSTQRDSTGVDCSVCGRYEITRSVLGERLDLEHAGLTARQRATLSQRLRTAVRDNAGPMITTDWLEHFKSASVPPTPAERAAILIRVIGDHVSETGEPYFPDESMSARAGA